MTYYSFWRPSYSGELYHYGVIGMKWGVHRAKRAIAAREKARTERDSVPQEKGRFKNKEDYERYAYADLDFAKAEERRSSIANKMHDKASAKLERINAKYEKKQAKADKYFAKGERKANSVFSSKKAADRAFQKAAKLQFKANKVASKGKRWYERMQKSYGKIGTSVTLRDKEIGEEFIRQVRANSRAMYAASYAGG